MTKTFTTRRRVEFRDTDAAGIAHFSSFFYYMEEAEHALLRELGTSVVVHDAEGAVSWPRVSAACDYTGSVKFEDMLDLALSIERLGRSSVTYVFDFTRDGAPVARGRMVSVHCRIPPGGAPESTPIPEPLAARLREYMAE